MSERPTVAEWIRTSCEAVGTTFRDLAESVGAPYGTVQSWVNGRRIPSREAIKRLGEVFGTSEDELRDVEWQALEESVARSSARAAS